ncbi:MAG: hypothetical protein E6I75_09035 [Chloroflexi bacterium]|nr:MAG: hypothetical protein E6I75_09035 [Chloroflexota bacterium]TMF02198.1 MAG: hypothetical protein E6I52_10020 [Chloroflexota bacterium]
MTGSIRVIAAIYLLASSVITLADPQRAAADQGMPMGILLPVAGLSFALGAFLLTGFMSRVCGLILACLGAFQVASYGVGIVPIVEGLVGVHLMLRGGGAWAMDIYVQKMQDRARGRVVSRES